MSRSADDRAPSAGPLRPARVRVPCSTSNLGGGFDCVGLALDRFLDVRFEPGDEALSVVTESGEPPPAGEDLVERAFRDSRRERGAEPTGRLHVRSDIPIGRGLGSSAAALVAGTALGQLAAGEPLQPDAAFDRAARAESHGDNAAPSAYGGLIVVIPSDNGVRALPRPLSPDLGFAFAAPPTRTSTRAARAVLPESVPHHLAAAALPRLAALLHGLATADPDLLRIGFDDRLHVPHRIRLIPGGAEAIAAARDAGAWGATVSGSGSGLIAVGPDSATDDLARAMRHALERYHNPATIEAGRVRPVQTGVQTLEPTPN